MKYLKLFSRLFLKWLKRIFKIIVIIILIPVSMHFLSWSYHRIHASLLSSESRWIKDLDKFQEALTNNHISPDWSNARESIVGRIDSLKQFVLLRDGNVDRDSMRVELMKTAALLRDGHTRIANYNKEVGNIPISFEWYNDGIYIVEADSSLIEIVGSKVLGVNNNKMDEVISKIFSICPSSNIGGKRKYAKLYLKKPALLYGLGLSTDKSKTNFKLKTFRGDTISIKLDGFKKRVKSIRLEDISNNAVPVHQQQKEKAYWYTYFEENKLLYLNYNSVQNMQSISMDDFVDELMIKVDSIEIDKFVIDIRDNGGGDLFFTTKLVHEIQKRPKLNKKGVLFSIIGSDTFSAAICFATNLMKRTNVTFIGEEMADVNNFPGDPKFIDLHMNQFTWQIADLYWENTLIDDFETRITPEIIVQSTFEDDFNGRNPILNKIMDYSVSSEFKKDTIQKDLHAYSGRYQLDLDRTITLNIEEETAKISGFIELPLQVLNDSIINLDRIRHKLLLSNNNVYILKNNQEKIIIKRLKDDEYTALELIEKEKYDLAKNAYLNLVNDNKNKPESHSLDANNLSLKAWNLYYHTQNQEMHQEFLNIILEAYPKSMMALGRMSQAKSIEGEGFKSFIYRFKSLLYFDWKNVVNYGEAFGFL